jgi:hypothetical protein
MLGPGVYFALTPQETCGKAQHGQPTAMMLECYVHVGEMDIAQGRSDFRRASGADAVYYGGRNGRPEFVVKDNNRICIICAFQCDPANGNRIGDLDEASRSGRLQWAQTVWKEQRLNAEVRFERKADKFGRALDCIQHRGKSTKKDRKKINKLFDEFAGEKGCLNKAELYALLCALDMPPENNKGDLKATFAEFDINGNGTVSRKEFRREMIFRAKEGDLDFD